MKIDPDQGRILIVGAHGGRDYNWLTGFGYHVEILDLGHHEWAKSTYIGDACSTATWEKIETEYDVVLMHDVLEHLPEDFAALCYARNVLKPHGYLFLSVPYQHDPETTHVRAYSEATLNRLLVLAGYKNVWKRDRPGLIEAFPRLINLLNYGLSVAMPTTRMGARFLHTLLRVEYSANEVTRRFYRLVGHSPQKGLTLAAQQANAVPAGHVVNNARMFIGV